MSTPGEENPPHGSTVAILGNSPVISRAIAHLVECGGYETRVVGTVQDNPGELVGVDVVLVTADFDPGDWKTQNWSSTVPVLRLVDTAEEKERLEEMCILWPCATGRLHSALSMVAAEERQQGHYL